MFRGLAKRWAHVSLRAKITGVTVFILSLGLLVAGAGTLSFLQPQLIAQQDTLLQQLRADPTTALAPGANTAGLGRDDVLYAPDRYYVAVLDTSGALRYDNSRGSGPESGGPPITGLTVDQIEHAASGVLSVEGLDGSEWRAVAAPIHIAGGEQPSGVLLIASSTALVDSFMARYITIFSGFGIAVILLGAALTRILVTTTFEPLAEVERTAAQIAAGDFSQRIGVADTNTEVGHLGRSLNTMLDRIDDSFRDRAETIEQMRRFVGDASHELRTPLVSVRGYAELYRMGALQSPEQVGQAMERIEKEAIRMGSLVEDLLALARLDERRPMQMVPLDLTPLARDAALDTMAQAQDRTVRVIVDPSADAPGTTLPEAPAAPELVADPAQPETPGRGSARVRPEANGSRSWSVGRGEPKRGTKRGTDSGEVVSGPATGGLFSSATLAKLRQRRMKKVSLTDTQPIDRAELALLLSEEEAAKRPAPSGTAPLVLGDENRVRQVMTNLLGNALRYSPAGTPIEIRVSCQPEQGTARFEIIDHGEGIPAPVREKIFERFWRADNSRNRETGGSGLGLAIVSSIVAAHQGRVSAHETPGGGATFRVELPLLATPAPPA